MALRLRNIYSSSTRYHHHHHRPLLRSVRILPLIHAVTYRMSSMFVRRVCVSFFVHFVFCYRLFYTYRIFTKYAHCRRGSSHSLSISFSFDAMRGGISHSFSANSRDRIRVRIRAHIRSRPEERGAEPHTMHAMRRQPERHSGRAQRGRPERQSARPAQCISSHSFYHSENLRPIQTSDTNLIGVRVRCGRRNDVLGIVHWRCDGLDNRSRIVDGRRCVRLDDGRRSIVQRSRMRIAHGRSGVRIADGRSGMMVGGQRHGRMSIGGRMTVGIRSVRSAAQIAGRNGSEQQRQNALDWRAMRLGGGIGLQTLLANTHCTDVGRIHSFDHWSSTHQVEHVGCGVLGVRVVVGEAGMMAECD